MMDERDVGLQILHLNLQTKMAELLLVWSSPSHEGPPVFAIVKLSCPALLQRATAGSVQRKFPLNSYVHQRTLMDKSSGDTYAIKKINKLSEVSQS